MVNLEKLFGVQKPVIGVVHLPPLPGSPLYKGDMRYIVERALKDAVSLIENGVDGLIIENFGDKPFTKSRIPREGFALMAIILSKIVEFSKVPVGVNVLRNDALSAMALAYVTGCEFIRVNVYTDTVVTDQGVIEPIAWRLLNYRKRLNTRVYVFADVLVKHGKPLVNLSIEEAVKNAGYRGLADAVIITGPETGSPVEPKVLRRAKRVIGEVPIIVGSGVNPQNVIELLSIADGVIVGTYFKKEGVTENPVEGERVRKLVSIVREVFS